MSIHQPRRIFQIDGINSGVISIAERPGENRVLLVISNEGQESQIALSKEAYLELADLKWDLRFSDPENPQAAPAFKVVA